MRWHAPLDAIAHFARWTAARGDGGRRVTGKKKSEGELFWHASLWAGVRGVSEEVCHLCQVACLVGDYQKLSHLF